MGPQVQPKCSWHVKHMRNNWELRKRGYLIRFGHTEALLLKKKDIKQPFFPPCRNWPICYVMATSIMLRSVYTHVLTQKMLCRRVWKCEKYATDNEKYAPVEVGSTCCERRGPHMNPKCSQTPYSSAVNSLLHETEMITKGFRISYRILEFFF